MTGSLSLPPAKDILSSFVVFLVALPLCMGIAIASGAPPALGLITGIIGGLVVGAAAGSPLQVSGPAAGLAVIVWDLIQVHGLAALGAFVLAGGLIQLLAGLAGLGRLFRAVSPSVIHGMLAGIGVLIFGSQFHVMLDHKPPGDGLENLITIPVAVRDALVPMDWSQHQQAALIGFVTIASIVLWNNFRPERLRVVPGPLLGVLAGTMTAQLEGFATNPVVVPEQLTGALNIPSIETFTTLAVTPAFWGAALALAAVASAESLLCATATDALHDGKRTNYDRELAAQGFGNMICGVLGALPMTGVIVRSTANVDAGATTRWSAWLHGVWLLALIVLLPGMLGLIPTASLAAVLVYIGFRLVKPEHVRVLRQHGTSEVIIYAATVITIVAADLLTGVGLGIVLAVLRLLWKAVRIDVVVKDEADELIVDLIGHASFITLPKLAEKLEELPKGRVLQLELTHLQYLDHATIELLENWADQYERGGGEIHGWPAHHHPHMPDALNPDKSGKNGQAAK